MLYPCIIYDILLFFFFLFFFFFFAKNKLTLLVITSRPVYLQIGAFRQSMLFGISVFFGISVLFGNSMDPDASAGSTAYPLLSGGLP